MDWTSLLMMMGHPPGVLVYHLVIGSALLVIFITALHQRKVLHRSTAPGRIAVGIGVLLVLQGILAVINLFLIPSDLVSEQLAAVAESLLHALTLVWLIWVFIEQDETFLFTGGAIFISLALFLWTATGSGLILLQPDFLPAEINWLFTAWDLGGIALAALGCVILLGRRPQGWQAGIAILLALGLGYSLPFLYADPASLRPGVLRLAQTLALPWILILLQRLRETAKPQSQMADTRDRVDITPLLVDELLKIAQLEDENEKYRSVACALSLSLVADMCYLIKSNGPNENPVLLAGYDLIQEKSLPTPPLSREGLPNIFNAWQTSRPFAPGYPPVGTREAATLTEMINFHRTGHILAYPLGSQTLKGGVVFLSPYTDKQLAKRGLSFMETIEETLTRVLFEPGQNAKLAQELESVRAQAETAQLAQKALSHSLSESQETITDQEQQIRQLKARYQIEKLKLVKEIEACQEKIIQLSSQAASHKQNLAKLDELKSRIQTLVVERQQLENKLADAKAQIQVLETKIGQTPPPQEELQSGILSLEALTANLKEAFEPRCQLKGVNLEIINPDGHQLIKSHPIRLQALIHQLLENGLGASPEDGTLQLRVKLSFETGMLQVQVTDSGEGLSQEDQKILFNQTDISPVGIGSLSDLREAVRIVQALKGKIWLRSKPGVFTTYRAQLPVRILD